MIKVIIDHGKTMIHSNYCVLGQFFRTQVKWVLFWNRTIKTAFSEFLEHSRDFWRIKTILNTLNLIQDKSNVWVLKVTKTQKRQWWAMQKNFLVISISYASKELKAKCRWSTLDVVKRELAPYASKSQQNSCE